MIDQFDTGGKKSLQLFRLRAMISAIKLEKAGLRHSRGRSVKAQAAKELGLSVRTPHDKVMEALREEIDRLADRML